MSFSPEVVSILLGQASSPAVVELKTLSRTRESYCRGVTFPALRALKLLKDSDWSHWKPATLPYALEDSVVSLVPSS